MKISNIIGFAVGPIGAAILGFISMPILAWSYTPEDIGKLSMMQVAISFSVIFACLGLDQAYVREYHEHNNKPELLRTVVLPGLLILFLISVISFILSPTLISNYLFSVDNSLLSLVISATVIIAFLSRFLSLILRMQERGLAFSMSQVLPKLIFLIIIMLFIFWGSSLSFYNLIVAQTSSVLTVFLLFVWNTRKIWKPVFSSYQEINFVYLRSILNFGLPLMFGGMAYWMLTGVDKVLLRSLSSFYELGVYSIAMSVAAVAAIISSIFNTIWAPTVFKWVSKGENLSRIDAITENLLAAIYFIICITGVLSWIIPWLLPNAYNQIQYLIPACMIVPLYYMLSETTAVGIAVSKKTFFSLIASLIAAVINIIGNYLLIPTYGAIGAAVSTSFSFWIFVIARTEFCQILWRKTPRVKLYFFITLLLLMCNGFAFYGAQYKVLMNITWLALLIIGLYSFKGSILELKTFLTSTYHKLKYKAQ